MGLLGNLFGAIRGFFSGGGGGVADLEEQVELQRAIARAVEEVNARTSETLQYGTIADERYLNLLYNNLMDVPAVDKYNGNYYERLQENASSTLDNLGNASDEREVDGIMRDFQNNLSTTATEIQTFLHEDTSDLELAKVWHAKMLSNISHIPPRTKDQDDNWSYIMRVYREFSEINFWDNVGYDSDNAINLIYELVEEGRDIGEILNNIYEERQVNGELNEYGDAIVPNAGLFGGLLF